VAEEWEPTPADVKAQIPARVDGDPFSATTTPNLEQVEDIITKVVADILAYIDNTPVETDAHKTLASYTAAVGAAAVVERGIDPEQATDADSVYQRLADEYDRLLGNLRYALLGVEPDEEGGARLGSPTHSFPEWVQGVTPSDERFVPISTKAF
jgi:hypothetical protein